MDNFRISRTISKIRKIWWTIVRGQSLSTDNCPRKSQDPVRFHTVTSLQSNFRVKEINWF
jgi:hypothetical protein